MIGPATYARDYSFSDTPRTEEIIGVRFDSLTKNKLISEARNNTWPNFADYEVASISTGSDVPNVAYRLTGGYAFNPNPKGTREGANGELIPTLGGAYTAYPLSIPRGEGTNGAYIPFPELTARIEYNAFTGIVDVDGEVGTLSRPTADYPLFGVTYWQTADFPEVYWPQIDGVMLDGDELLIELTVNAGFSLNSIGRSFVVVNDFRLGDFGLQFIEKTVDKDDDRTITRADVDAMFGNGVRIDLSATPTPNTYADPGPYLRGTDDNDVLEDSSANDVLDGGAGNDRYEFKFQSGSDLVIERPGEETTLFFEGSTLEEHTIRPTAGGFLIDGDDTNVTLISNVEGEPLDRFLLQFEDEQQLDVRLIKPRNSDQDNLIRVTDQEGRTVLRFTTEKDGDTRDVRYDVNGVVRTIVSNDASGTKSYLTNTKIFDESGYKTSQTIFRDDGVIVTNEYTKTKNVLSRSQEDILNNYDWSTKTTYFDDESVKTFSFVVNDDGNTHASTFRSDGSRSELVIEDVSGSSSFQTKTISFAVDGTRTAQVVTEDDGDVRSYSFHENNAVFLLVFEDKSDTKPWATRTTTYDTDGSVVDVVFVDDDPLLV